MSLLSERKIMENPQLFVLEGVTHSFQNKIYNVFTPERSRPLLSEQKNIYIYALTESSHSFQNKTGFYELEACRLKPDQVYSTNRENLAL
jgi:hypothetical protein